MKPAIPVMRSRMEGRGAYHRLPTSPKLGVRPSADLLSCALVTGNDAVGQLSTRAGASPRETAEGSIPYPVAPLARLAPEAVAEVSVIIPGFNEADSLAEL